MAIWPVPPRLSRLRVGIHNADGQCALMREASAIVALKDGAIRPVVSILTTQKHAVVHDQVGRDRSFFQCLCSAERESLWIVIPFETRRDSELRCRADSSVNGDALPAHAAPIE